MTGVNQRAVAARAGVSLATVSLALRADRRISAATRRRVLAAAAELGYRPNALVAALMTQVRGNRPVAWRASLAVLLQRPAGRSGGAPAWLFPDFRIGVERRAAQLGFTLDVMELGDDFDPGRLSRVLRSRGVRGIVVPSLLRSQSLAGLPLDEFAVATIGHRVTDPEMPRVQTDQGDAVRKALAEVTRAGFRRPGLVLLGDNDPRTNEAFVGAFGAAEFLGAHSWPAALLLPRWDASGERAFAAWLRRERPDVVLHTTSQNQPLRWLERLPPTRRPAFVGLLLRQAGRWPGVVHDLQANGAACVDLVAGALLRNEIPSPTINQITLIKGRWHAGRGQMTLAVSRRSRS